MPALEFACSQTGLIKPQEWVSTSLEAIDVARLDPVELEVAVELTHPHAGGLALWLQAPGGSYYRLHTSDGRDLDQPLPANYTLDISNEEVDGAWQLWVYDAYSPESGRLERWSAKF
ncbi:proprotein convertase P-domain-containing protein [Luteipulveratus mongoliensis]|uniref:proprotein convertase P-domain-containing protein n=1 Tax=Luteipulveratus mongoliensis TaxID=571913 RepID=UPI00147010DC|nr:proprotein convertase P-domain-containing protein [Luteipulveratus mongoliensis]